MVTMTNTRTEPYPSPSIYVREFMETYGQTVRTEPTADIPERLLRSQLILEEASELWEAERDNDLVEIADALGDELFVTFGAALAHGIDLDSSFGGTEYTPAEVLRIIHRRQGKKIKPAPTKNVMGRKMIVSGIQKATIAYSKYVTETAPADLDTEQMRSMLTTIVSACYFASFSFGIDIDEVLQEIMASNMSKLGEDGLPIYREDGKVLKGPNFFEPKILEILKKQGFKG